MIFIMIHFYRNSNRYIFRSSLIEMNNKINIYSYLKEELFIIFCAITHMSY